MSGSESGRKFIRIFYLPLLFFLAATGYALSDPTMPPNWEAQSTPSLSTKNIVLSGVFVTDHKPTAVINSKTVGVGDFVLGYEITKITERGVYFKNSRGTFVILLNAKVTTPVTNGSR